MEEGQNTSSPGTIPSAELLKCSHFENALGASKNSKAAMLSATWTGFHECLWCGHRTGCVLDNSNIQFVAGVWDMGCRQNDVFVHPAMPPVLNATGWSHTLERGHCWLTEPVSPLTGTVGFAICNRVSLFHTCQQLFNVNCGHSKWKAWEREIGSKMDIDKKTELFW